MDEKTGNAAKEKLRELIKDAKIAMLATRGEDGLFHSRPMSTNEAEFDGTLWFLTDQRTHKVDQLITDPEVLVTYSDERKQNYVSVAGTGSVVRDRAKIKELWTEVARAWFPDGPDDPNIVALRINVSVAEYWDAPSAKLVILYGYAKAVLTGDRKAMESGEHGFTRF